MSEQLIFELGARESLDEGDFLVAPANEAAIAWLDRWPDWPAPALAIYGAKGCGKTHLVHVWQKKTDAVLLAPDDLTDLFLAEKIRTTKAVALDDAAAFVGDSSAESRLFHLYNMMKEQGGHLLLTADMPPAQWNIGLADLRSRLQAAPAVEVGAPDELLLVALMTKLFADRQVQVDPAVLDWLLPRMERSFSAAQNIVDALDRAALTRGRRITLPLARDVMAKVD